MVFLKIVKDKAYYKRYQVKFRRRRQAKTDYYARKRLVVQDKNKYNTPKYRLVVRFSNKVITCQIVHSKWNGDVILAAAYSSELPVYGVKYGLCNYAAAYCTGLLVARRALSKLDLADAFTGVEEVTGDMFMQDSVEGRRPFSAILDVGLVHATRGSRVFGALKGCADGGVYIPHSPSRFPGYEDPDPDFQPKRRRGRGKPAPEKPVGELDVETHRRYIFGQHVADYLRVVAADRSVNMLQFARYIKDGISADDIEGIYAAAHTAIRAGPFKGKVKREKFKGKSYSKRRRCLAERKNRIKQIKIAFAEKLAREAADA